MRVREAEEEEYHKEYEDASEAEERAEINILEKSAKKENNLM
jgi:hypothetical protein